MRRTMSSVGPCINAVSDCQGGMKAQISSSSRAGNERSFPSPFVLSSTELHSGAGREHASFEIKLNGYMLLVLRKGKKVVCYQPGKD